MITVARFVWFCFPWTESRASSALERRCDDVHTYFKRSHILYMCQFCGRNGIMTT